jgi:hypothetical protein
MNLSRLPFLVLLLVVSALAFAPQLQAGASNKSGSPFGNGTYFPNSGTFSAIMRSTNAFLGITQFTASGTNTSISNTVGLAVVYAGGQQYQGSSFGTVTGSTIACVYGLGFTTQTNVTGTNGGATVVTLTNTFCGGQFSGSLFNSYPTQSFNATGQCGVGPSTSNLTIYTTSVTGSRLTQ